MSQIVFAALVAIAFGALYLVNRAVRAFIGWINRTPGPRERLVPYLVIFGVAGGVVGGLMHAPYTAAAQQCRVAGKPVIPCVLSPI